jgi:hypothetical protein
LKIDILFSSSSFLLITFFQTSSFVLTWGGFIRYARPVAYFRLLEIAIKSHVIGAPATLGSKISVRVGVLVAQPFIAVAVDKNLHRAGTAVAQLGAIRRFVVCHFVSPYLLLSVTALFSSLLLKRWPGPSGAG